MHFVSFKAAIQFMNSIRGFKSIMSLFMCLSLEAVARLSSSNGRKHISGDKVWDCQSRRIDSDLGEKMVGGIPTHLKNMSSSIGMMTFPIYGNIIQSCSSHQPVMLIAVTPMTPTAQQPAPRRSIDVENGPGFLEGHLI